MNSYNNGPVPPYQNNGSGYPPYYTPPTRHPGSGFATASMVLGILAVISAFFLPTYPPIICGGLSIILGLLSKGNDKAMLPNAKVGLLTGILGMVINVLIVGSIVVMIFTNPAYKQSFHDQLNQYSEYLYGESFDDMWDQIQKNNF